MLVRRGNNNGITRTEAGTNADIGKVKRSGAGKKTGTRTGTGTGTGKKTGTETGTGTGTGIEIGQG